MATGPDQLIVMSRESTNATEFYARLAHCNSGASLAL